MLIVCVVAGTGCGSADDGIPADENLNVSARRGGSSDGDAPKQPESESGNVPAVGKAAPKSDLGKIIFRAKSTIGAASTQAAENAEIMEKATAKPPAPSAAKTPAAPAKTVSDTAKKPTPALASKAAVPDKGELAKAPDYIKVASIFGTAKRRTAMVRSGGKNYSLMKGDKSSLAKPGGGTLDIVVMDVTDKTVVIKIAGEAKPRVITR
ncbi:MAG: hypothetical protein ACI9VS_001568 [Candidatus Binatia bacterium]|jgi:hypothetical protein